MQEKQYYINCGLMVSQDHFQISANTAIHRSIFLLIPVFSLAFNRSRLNLFATGHGTALLVLSEGFSPHGILFLFLILLSHYIPILFLLEYIYLSNI